MVLINSATEVSIADINEIENSLELVFPNDYKSFMLKSNGGVPKTDVLYDFFDEVLEAPNTSVIRRFYSLYTNFSDSNRYDLIKIYKTMLREQTIAKTMLPIADDPAGNPICISLEESDYGAIYYLNHEFEEIETSFLIKSKIADSFSDFINCLYSDE